MLSSSRNGLTRRSRRTGACVIPLLLVSPMFAANLALQISNETAPAGGWAQIKIYSATPQLVAFGRLIMKFDAAVFGSARGVAVFSAQGDAVGVATVSGQSLDVTFSSRAGGIGQLPQLPMLTVTLPILASAPAGTVSAITLDAGRTIWSDAQNNSYTVTVAPGSVTVGGNLSVRDATATGALVRIRGTGFSAATTADIDALSVARVQFVNAGEIDLTLDGAADVTGKRILLRNANGEQAVFFGAISSMPDQAPASVASLQPMLSMQMWTGAQVQFTIRGGSIALQNPNATAVDVILQAENYFSAPEDSQTTVTVPPGALVVYYNGGGDITGFLAFAPLPIRMLGLANPSPNAGIYPAAPFPAVPPVKQLPASPASVSFQWQIGTAAPAPVSVRLSSTQNTVPYFSFGMTAPAPFVVTSTRTVSPAILTVSVNTAGLKEGTYAGDLVVTPAGPNAVITTIPLSLTVSTAALVTVNPQSLTFSGPSKYSQNLAIGSNGNPVAFTAAASDGSGPHWLTVSPANGTSGSPLTVSMDSTSLADGMYRGQVAIAGPNNTVTVPVQLSVSNSNQFTFSPPAVTFSVQTGSDPPPAQTVLVSGSSTGAAFSASTQTGGSWLRAVITPSGQLGAVINVNPAGLKAGTYNGSVTMTSPYTPFPSVIPVALVIWDREPALTVTPASVTYTITMYDNPNVPAPPVVRVDSGGVPMNFTVLGTPGLFTTPATIPAYAGSTGTLGTSAYDITITGGTQKVLVPVTTIVTTSAQAPPFIGAIVNAASQMPRPVSPGEILTIYGFGAGPSNPAGFTLDASGKIATGLNGAQVLFDGRPAPMTYGSAYQANVIVPYEVAGQASTMIALKFGGVTSAAWVVPVASSSPGIFALGSSGVGAAAVLNQDNAVNDAAHPAARGSIVQIYATGEGQTSPVGVTGAVTGSDLKMPVLPVKVTIGGQVAVVVYVGSAGNAVAGLLQVNAVVPQSLTPGAAVPIAISVAGVASQDRVTIAVR